MNLSVHLAKLRSVTPDQTHSKTMEGECNQLNMGDTQNAANVLTGFKRTLNDNDERAHKKANDLITSFESAIGNYLLVPDNVRGLNRSEYECEIPITSTSVADRDATNSDHPAHALGDMIPDMDANHGQLTRAESPVSLVTDSTAIAILDGTWTVAEEDGSSVGVALVTVHPVPSVVVWGVEKYTYSLLHKCSSTQNKFVLSGTEEWEADVSEGTVLHWTSKSSDMRLKWTFESPPAQCDTSRDTLVQLLDGGRMRGFEYRWAMEECHISNRLREVSRAIKDKSESIAMKILTSENCVGIDRVTWDRKFAFMAKHPKLNSYRCDINFRRGSSGGVCVSGVWRNTEVEAAQDTIWFLQHAVPCMIADPIALREVASEVLEVEVDVDMEVYPADNTNTVADRLEKAIAECDGMDPKRAAGEWFDEQYKNMRGPKDLDAMKMLMNEAESKTSELMEKAQSKKTKLLEALHDVMKAKEVLAQAQAGLSNAETNAMAVLHGE